jgi:hypothetical protein
VQTDQRNNYRVIENRKALSAQDERTWSVLAHLSMFVNLGYRILGAGGSPDHLARLP